MVAQGVCVVAPWGRGVWLLLGGAGHVWLLWRGHVWLLLGLCMVAPGEVHGCSGGHVWLLGGACMVAPMGCVVAPMGCVVAPGGQGMCGCSGGHAWLLPGGAWMVAPRGVHGCSGGACLVAPGGHAWDTTRYRDTINERAVRILLECILVG